MPWEPGGYGLSVPVSSTSHSFEARKSATDSRTSSVVSLGDMGFPYADYDFGQHIWIPGMLEQEQNLNEEPILLQESSLWTPTTFMNDDAEVYPTVVSIRSSVKYPNPYKA